MKNTKLILLMIAMIFISCSENELEKSLIQFEDNSDMCTELIDDVNPNATWCCIQRNSRVDDDNIVEYQYHTQNIDINVTYEWTVLSGDIEIISGGDTNKVQVLLKKDLTTAQLRCSAYENIDISGSQVGNLCNVRVTITQL